jgi:endonuclease/exonuclease/phosphatase family metal-dependent hydrolase
MTHGGTSADSAVLSGERPLRVFTMNIWNFAEPYEQRQQLLREGILRLDPDLLAFQEAGFDGRRDQVRDLLDGAGYHIAHQFDSLASPPARDGCCVASRWPFDLVEVLSLQLTPECARYPYAAVAVRVAAPDPVGPMLFVCAKPSWELNRERERELQAVALVGMIRRHARRAEFPTVIAGDFDATPDSASIRFLTGRQSLEGTSAHCLDAWQQAGDGSPGYTWTYRNGFAAAIIDQCIRQPRHERRIDYVFLGSPHDHDRFARVRAARVVLDTPADGVWPSDHYAVYAEIEVAPGRGPGLQRRL